MHTATALPRPTLARLRSALSIVALAAVLALIVRLLIGSTPPPPGLVEALRGRQAPAVKQSAATACFRASPAVSAVRSAGTVVLVRFAGQRSFMRLQFFSGEHAAIRDSYAHGSPNSFYDNTVWSGVPARLTNGEIHALSTCLPMPKL
ncbi:MAG TPA: hypothetical protein VKS25_09860 [Solirubrobacteraceae bacterium]|nr:hypothetical protein [Solirubrobacteraceae bacterium]